MTVSDHGKDFVIVRRVLKVTVNGVGVFFFSNFSENGRSNAFRFSFDMGTC